MVPAWLEAMLSSGFFTVCRTHGESSTRSECNMYCIDCTGSAFCYYCRAASHMDHRVIQIRRSSYHDVVRVEEIENVLDISGVQTYVINSARVVFLNKRPQPKTGKGTAAQYSCEICGRTLLDPFRFCSLGCKLVGIRKKGDASPVPNKESKREGNLDEKELRESSQHRIYPPTPSPSASRRKGIPHRAPFAS